MNISVKALSYYVSGERYTVHAPTGRKLKRFKDVCDRKILHTEFFKIQYIIIQAILSRKSMKKIIITNEKIFDVYKAFDRER